MTSSKFNFVSQNNSDGVAKTHNSLKFLKKDSTFKKNNKKKYTLYYHCDKKGYYIREHKFRNVGKNFGFETSKKANIVEEAVRELMAMKSELHIKMITELNMVTAATKYQDWWLDSGVAIHVCNDRKQFKSYEVLKNPEEILMKNHITAKVKGKGTVELNFTSG